MLRTLLDNRGLLGLFLTSMLGRLPLGAVSLVLILRTREVTGSYAAGGLVAAVSALAHGAASPLLGRVVDRRGQTGVLVLAACVHAVAMIGFAALPDGTGLEPALVLAAIAGAAHPPLTACQRAIWSDVLPDTATRHKLYSLEAAVFEIIYICGPLLILTGIGAWSLQAAAVMCGLFTLSGSLAFAAAPLSRAWRPAVERAAGIAGALRGAGVRTLLASFFLFGCAIAAVEIAVAAFASDAGERWAVGPILALWGVGSLIGGVVSGRRHAPADPPRRLAWLTAGLAAGTAPLALAADLWSLGALIVVAGVFIAPALACAFGLLADVAPPGTATEAQTLIATGLGGGIAAGSALGGWAIEVSGTTLSLGIAVAAMVGAAWVIGMRIDVLRADAAPAQRAAAAEAQAAPAVA